MLDKFFELFERLVKAQETIALGATQTTDKPFGWQPAPVNSAQTVAPKPVAPATPPVAQAPVTPVEISRQDVGSKLSLLAKKNPTKARALLAQHAHGVASGKDGTSVMDDIKKENYGALLADVMEQPETIAGIQAQALELAAKAGKA